MYINTDLIECIDQDKEDKLTRLYVCGGAESYYKCQETPEELMKIITYFKVANDK